MLNPEERWLPVRGYEGLYEVSDQGKVRRIAGNVLSVSLSNGYRQVKLSKYGKQSSRSVARLVAQAFIPNPYRKAEVNHKDRDRSNDRVSNLEWTTHLENAQHAANNGKYHTSENPGQCLLTEQKVKFIIDAEGRFFQKQLAEQFGVTQQAISEIWRGKNWKEIERTRKPNDQWFPRKLTNAQVNHIRAMKGLTTQEKVAKQFKVSQACISKIWSGELWGN
jgi:DNA-binding XRE family transcriptional regulator